MLRSSMHPQYPIHPTFKSVGVAPVTRQSREKMSHHPYQRPNGLSKSHLCAISGLKQNYAIERDAVIENQVDCERTGWKQLQNLLNLALKNDDTTLVNAILKSQLPSKVVDNDPKDITLWFALQMDDIETAIQLFRAGTDLNKRYPVTGASYLHWLASKADEKYLSLATMMIKCGADINAIDKFGNSVLHVAAEFGLPRSVEELIQKNVNVDIVNKAGESVLFAAAKNPKAVDILSMLIGYSGDVVTRNKRCIDAAYALIETNASNLRIQMKALLDLGFPLDQYGKKGYTLLYEAVLVKKIEVVELLLQYGSNVNKKLRSGKLPLHAAVQHEDTDIFKLLIENGASVHKYSDDYNCRYPIHSACERASLQNIKLLLQLGANVNVKDKNGRTPFSLVSSNNFTLQSWIIKYLAIAMAKENSVNQNDLTKIRANLDMQDYYEKCLIELQTMKETNIFENMPFFHFFDRSLIDLLSFVKVDSMKISDDIRRKWKDMFPVYYAEICDRFTQAKQMKFLINKKAQIVRKTSKKILPDNVVDLITFYACLDEIKQMQQNYYISNDNK